MGSRRPQWTASAWNQLAAVREHLALGQRVNPAEFDGGQEVRAAESLEFLKRYLPATRR